MTIAPLPTKQQKRLQQGRAQVFTLLGEHINLCDLTIAARLGHVQAGLDNALAQGYHKENLLAFGVIFGDFLAERLMLDWVWVDDELGTTTALNWPGTTILCFPVTMILNHYHDGEVIDLASLFKHTCDHILDLAFNQDTI